MKKVYNELWERVYSVPGSYEFKAQVVWQAARAIREQNPVLMYESISTFNPNYPEDGVTEYPKQIVTQFVRENGIEEYVKEKIEKLNV